MTTRKRGAVSDTPPISRHHATLIDTQRTVEELLFEVFRLTHPILHRARQDYRRVPAPRTPEWWSAPDSVKVAGLLTLSGEYLLVDPDRLAVEKLKAAAVAISGATDWSRVARERISYADLQVRRARPGPVRPFNAEAARRWVETGSNEGGAG